MPQYKITCYCSACNSPKGSRETASGETATAVVTVAVHRNKYSKNKVINIEKEKFKINMEIRKM